MTEATKDVYLAHFAQFEGAAAHNGQAWTQPLREAAIARFAELGFPTTRQEEWKYTNVAPIARVPFQPAQRTAPRLASAALAAATMPELVGVQVVFINGHYAPELSALQALPQGVEVDSLARSLSRHPSWLEAHLTRYASFEEAAFVALNTAFMHDGACVYIPHGRAVDVPIHLVFVSLPHGEAMVSHPRNLLVLEDGAQATVIESYIGLADDVYLTNAVTELILGQNASAQHCKLEREGRGAFHIATLQVEQGRGSTCVSHAVAIGGALVRHDINVVLRGEGGDNTLNGLFLATDEQHIDNHTRIDHVRPHCTSRELYKGILDAKGRGVFNGKIVVHKDAQQTDAMQTNKNLLLSADASIDTKPQLEIFNNDVKCSHGSTIGRLDEQSLFYLRTRGLGEDAARSLLTYAFASELVNRVPLAPLRTMLNDLVLTWLPRSQGVKEA
ncbi:MAG TPA: Fe-S cluster assembly protein SufD [Candidatus Tectomicrobia bacterium]|nr:Fe-S cluster assembly protein SufD [Candidatus Tectomicrobia bacterium]